MSKVDEAFERFCTKDGITSEQYKGDIKPAFEAGYRSGAAYQAQLKAQIARLKQEIESKDKRLLDYSWQTNPDRMGS